MMPDTVGSFQKLLALLSLLQLTYRCSHWESKGTDSYARHLLFERLYDEVEGDIDDVAEKVIGIYGPSCDRDIFIAEELCNLMAKMVSYYTTGSGGYHLGKSLELEQMVLKYLDRIYDEVKACGELTMGLDDFLMALYSKHEHNIYLLQQAMR